MSDTTLAAHYTAAAPTWHQKVQKLGYLDAYRALCAGETPGQHLLDVGCGSGALSLAAQSVARPAALDLLDPCAPLLAEAEQRVRVSGTPGQSFATELGSPGGPQPAAYDTVLCAHVLEHLPDFDAGLTWLASRLKPGGKLRLSISHPHWCTALIRWRWGNHAYTEREVTTALSRAGLTDIRIVRYENGPPSRTSRGYVVRKP